MLRIWLPLVLLLLPVPGAAGQDVLMLSDAIDEAMRQNANVTGAELAVGAAGLRVRQERVGFLPVLTFSTSVARANQAQKFPVPVDGQTRLIEMGSPNSMSLRLDVSYAVYDFGKVRLAVRAAEAAEAALEAAYRQQVVDVTTSVKREFYRAYYYMRRDTLSAAVIRVGEELEAISRRQVAAGDALPIEVLRAQSDLLSARADRAASHAELETSLAALAELMGRDEVDFTIESTLPDLPAPLDPRLLYDALYAQAVDGRPELEQLLLMRKQQELLAGAVRAQALPTLSVTASGSYLGPKSVFGIDEEGIQPYTFRIGLGFSFNLLGPYAAGMKAQEVLLDRARLWEDERTLRLSLASQIRTTLNRLAGQQATLHSSMALLDQAVANRELVRTSFETGAASLLDYTHAVSAAASAEIAVERTRLAVAELLLELERVVGAEILFSDERGE